MKLSVKWAFILGSILLVWGTHLIITPSSYLMSERVLTRHVRDIMQNIVDLTLEQSNNHLNKAKSAAYLAKQLLSANVVRSDISGISSLERYFFDQLSIYPHLSGIYFATPDGNFFFVSRNNDKSSDGYRTKIIRHDENGGREVSLIWRDAEFNLLETEKDPKDLYDPRKRPWFINVMEKRDVIWTSPYIFYSSQKPGITIAGPSFNEKGQLKGVVGVDIEIAELSTFISKLRVGKTGQAFMLNRNGDVIAYRDLENLIIRKKNSDSFRLPKVSEIKNEVVKKSFKSIDWEYDDDGFLRLNKPIYTSFTLDDKQYISMFAPFPDKRLPWIISVYIPEEDYLGEIKENRRFNIVATIIISIFASLLGLALAKNIVRPIVKLEKEAKAIEENDLQTSFEISSMFNEIQETANSFTRMKKSLISYKDSLVEKEAIHRAITDTTNDAIIILDETYHVTYWNPAAEQMFGYTSDEIIDNDIHQALSPSHYLGTHTNDIKSGKLSTGKTIQISAINKSGSQFPVEISICGLTLNDKWHLLAIMRDISKRVKGEQVKKQLVHDLHDGIGGNLTNIKLLAEILKNNNKCEGIEETLATIADISTDSISEIRNYMNVLDEKDLNWKSFVDELQQYCLRIVDTHQIVLSVSSDVEDGIPKPSTLLYMNLFRMVKEAVNNSIKHAEASNLALKFMVSLDSFQCIIQDDGVGLSPKPGTGRGMLTMQTRAAELGGTFEITSSDGVCVTINVPIRAKNS